MSPKKDDILGEGAKSGQRWDIIARTAEEGKIQG